MPTLPTRGATRRSFLVLVGLGGGASLAGACSPAQPAQTPAPTAAATKPAVVAAPTVAPPGTPVPAASPAAAAKPSTVPSAAASPAAQPVASPSAAPRLITKALPPEAYIPFGSNAEMRYEALKPDQLLIPAANFFVRNHVSTPPIDAATWKLSVEGSGVEKPLTLSYDELRKLPSTTLTRALECSGNGRSFFQSMLNRPAQGTQWKLGAWGVAEWTGTPLAEILQRAGVKTSATNVMPIGLDQPRVRRPMPLDIASRDDTLVVWGMNGQPLPPDHGFPVRVMVPGYVGINSTKWVGTIQVAEEPLYSDWNTKTYVLIGPDYPPREPALGPALEHQVMKAAVALPWPATLQAGPRTVRGYAWVPNGTVGKVDVSIDGGKTFQPATVLDPNTEKAGARWEFAFTAQAGDLTLTTRVTDDKGNAQPIDVATQKWNEQGYLFGVAVPHPVKVTA